MDLSSPAAAGIVPATGLSSGEPGDTRPARPDVFLSYAREDEEVAERLVAELETQGWSVFWDREIPPGKNYQEYIGTKLAQSSCAIVLWSKSSIASRWVTAESESAADRHVLVPALIEDVRPPVGVSTIQAAVLVDWKGESSHPELARLLAAVAAVLGAPPPEPPPPDKRRGLKRWSAACSLVAPIPALLLLASLPVGQADLRLQLRLSEVGFVLRDNAPLLTDPLDLSELGASALNEVELPAPVGSPGRYTTDLALLTAAGAEGQPASIAVELDVLNRGTQVSLRQEGSPSAYHLSLTGDLPELGATVDGTVRVLIPRSLDRRIDFQRARVALRPGAGELGLDLMLAPGHGTAFSAALPVDDLRLWRIDRYREAGRSADPVVSTVLSGAIEYESGGLPGLTLDKGQLIMFEQASGLIRGLQLGEDDISLLFAGQVRGMTTESGEGARNLMPSLLRSLWSRHTVALAFVMTAYALVFGSITYRTWTRRR